MNRFSRFVSLLAVAVLLAPPLFAAEDLTGKWSGSFNISINGAAQENETAYMVLKHAGKELSGTAGPNEGQQWPITKGVVTVTGTAPKETTKLSFEVHSGSGPAFQFELELIGGHLKGTGKAGQDGVEVVAQLDLTRVK